MIKQPRRELQIPHLLAPAHSADYPARRTQDCFLHFMSLIKKTSYVMARCRFSRGAGLSAEARGTGAVCRWG